MWISIFYGGVDGMTLALLARYMWKHIPHVFRTLRLFETSKFLSNPCHVKTHLSVGSHMAGWTGFEPATYAVTVRYSNQLNYHPSLFVSRPGSISKLGAF